MRGGAVCELRGRGKRAQGVLVLPGA